MKLKDITGQKFGILVVTGRDPSWPKSKGTRWFCSCECGGKTSVMSRDLKSGHTKSCGCSKGGFNRRVERGVCYTITYRVWSQMLWRCNPMQSSDPKYVALGVCDRWKSYESFLEDMGPRPSIKHSIDRIDNSRGYEPGNCRWATIFQQANNRSNNRKITFNGATKNMVEWAAEVGISLQTLSSRINTRKWTVERALTEPVNPIGRWKGHVTNYPTKTLRG